ncbi:MAG: cupin domain-containing protein [Proteobacteria bacterium]|nr:MAG: cupin domain-containing protein [Pseudomonadota bacterium]
MQFFRADTKETSVAPAEHFSGTVRLARFSQPGHPSKLSSAVVMFPAGARSAWHTHPMGQLLIVSDGTGLVQEWKQPAKRISKGDVIWTPPGVKHWHGACASSGMSHVTAVESDNGKQVEWMEKVTDEEFKAANKAAGEKI